MDIWAFESDSEDGGCETVHVLINYVVSHRDDAGSWSL